MSLFEFVDYLTMAYSFAETCSSVVQCTVDTGKCNARKLLFGTHTL